MAIKSATGSYDNALHMILALHEIRDNVRDGRRKRLALENDSQTRPTYYSGQRALLRPSEK